MKAHRVVVKVGSSSLTGDGGRISVTKMTALVKQVARLHQELNGQVVLVSSGAIAAGIGKLGWDRATCTMPEKTSRRCSWATTADEHLRASLRGRRHRDWPNAPDALGH